MRPHLKVAFSPLSVKKFSKNLAKKSIFLLNTKLSFRRDAYLKEIKFRSDLPLTDILKLSKPISILSAYTYEMHTPNDFYGHATILKKYLNFPLTYQFKFVLEHGALLDDHVNALEVESPLPTMIALSHHRTNTLKKYKPYSYAIGPYIHYAPHILDISTLAKEKKRLGKCLLVFPTHSTMDIDTSYDIEDFIQQIIKISKLFDTVRVCLYWKDILKGAANRYRSLGFECITAGHVLDYNFLPRLKSIIETSTYTMSNDPGTHLGYCLYMNKPHLIVKQKIEYAGLNSQVNLCDEIFQSKAYQKVVAEFSKTKNKITTKQHQLAKYYWGMNEIKTKPQLQHLVQLSEIVYDRKTE